MEGIISKIGSDDAMESNLEMAEKTLEILEIEHDTDASLSDMISAIENAFLLVTSESETRLQEITRDIAEMLRKSKDTDRIKILLEELMNEYLYSRYWD